ncbi:MAG: ATP-binding cassette domain-containing protein [Treponema sp.]|nr:ATP-binding cassette domain-containing protein [Treponema sp.]
MAFLEVQKLSRKYERKGSPFYSVKDVDLSLERGEFISITGASGSGKTTLLNLIAGLLLPSSGQILIDGNSAVTKSDAKGALLRNRVIGLVPQGYSLLSSLSVLDNVRLPFYLSREERKGDAEGEAMRLLSLLGIGELSSSYPANLSGGEIRRAAIARALINKPALLLADEPTGDLDAGNKEEIISLFRKIADGGTAVIMVTHDIQTLGCADRNFVMDKGILRAS